MTELYATVSVAAERLAAFGNEMAKAMRGLANATSLIAETVIDSTNNYRINIYSPNNVGYGNVFWYTQTFKYAVEIINNERIYALKSRDLLNIEPVIAIGFECRDERGVWVEWSCPKCGKTVNECPHFG